jgi:hypothetical protein
MNEAIFIPAAGDHGLWPWRNAPCVTGMSPHVALAKVPQALPVGLHLKKEIPPTELRLAGFVALIAKVSEVKTVSAD